MTGIVGKSLAKNPLMILRVTGARGDTLEVEQFVPARPMDIVQVMMFVEGEVSVQRISGVATRGGTPFVWRERMTTLDRPGADEIVFPGRHKFTVLSPTVKYYCIQREDQRKLDRTPWRPAGGGTLLVALGGRLFLAGGTVVESGVEYEGPKLINAKTRPLEFVAQGNNVFAILIRGV